jgi:uncharacterized membrane protein YedE/YeeE
METSFTPVLSLLGGGLIGVSAVLLMGLNGKIAGISGILSRLLTKDIGGTAERPGLFFVLGLLLAAPGWMLVTGQWPQQTISAGPVALIIAGLAVGYGSVTGNGCTSGHGVCGLSRLSGRSMVATATFMSTAAITVFVMRHVI